MRLVNSEIHENTRLGSNEINGLPNKNCEKSIIWVELYLLMYRPNYMLKQEVITNKIAYAGIDCGLFSKKRTLYKSVSK